MAVTRHIEIVDGEVFRARHKDGPIGLRSHDVESLAQRGEVEVALPVFRDFAHLQTSRFGQSGGELSVRLQPEHATVAIGNPQPLPVVFKTELGVLVATDGPADADGLFLVDHAQQAIARHADHHVAVAADGDILHVGVNFLSVHHHGQVAEAEAIVEAQAVVRAEVEVALAVLRHAVDVVVGKAAPVLV